MFKEIITIYSDNHIKPKKQATLSEQNVELLIVKAGGTYSYQQALKD
jgi:hypothetical protein